MANPQKENGYTPIANEIMEQLCKMRLNGTQFRIILVVLRYTYGFNRKSHTFGEIFIANATNTSKKVVARELNKLIEHKFINVVSESSFTKPRALSFNKNYDKWLPFEGQSTNRYTVHQSVPSTVHQLGDSTGYQLGDSTVPQSVPQERKHINTNLKKNLKKNIYCAFFDLLWDLYPNKKGKMRVSVKALQEINTVGFETMKECIERYVNNKPEWQHWQNGSTFFNGGYKDYLLPEVSEQPEPPKEEKQQTRYGGKYI